MKRRDVLSGLAIGATGMFLPWHGAQAGDVELLSYLRTNWSRDPHSFGSYSYIAKGAKQRDCKTLAIPIAKRLYFAGEATHPKHNSTVHSAYESGRTAARNVQKNTSGSVAVIGAGISGLVAAHSLSESGRSVTVFEARNRIGGRVWTSNALGLPLDMGASWIHGTRRNPITKLAKAANAKMVATDETYITRGAKGRLIKDRDVPEWLEYVTTIQQNAAADISDLNMDAYLAQPEYGGSEVVFPNGYQSIFPALDGEYEVRTSHEVTKISYGANGVTLTIKDELEHFDVVIVTLPLGVLKKKSVQFEPALPVDKQQAISRLGMGTLDKLYLRYDQAFWDENVTWIVTAENGLKRGHFNQWLNLYKYTREPIIMAFNGGSPALELSVLSDENLVLQAQQTLKNAYPASN